MNQEPSLIETVREISAKRARVVLAKQRAVITGLKEGDSVLITEDTIKYLSRSLHPYEEQMLEPYKHLIGQTATYVGLDTANYGAVVQCGEQTATLPFDVVASAKEQELIEKIKARVS